MPPRTDSSGIFFSNIKIRCGVMHDHVLLRQGLRRLLEDEPDIEVVSEAGNAAECLRKVHELQPDVVVADAAAFGLPAAEAELCLARESPHTKLVFLSGREREREDFFVSGVWKETGDCAVRQTSVEELVEMVRKASSRDRGSRSDSLLQQNLHQATTLFQKDRALTIREREVLKLLAEGKTVRASATVLGLSVKTVDAHKFNLMRKLGIHNKAELVMWAIQKRIVKVPANF